MIIVSAFLYSVLEVYITPLFCSDFFRYGGMFSTFDFHNILK